MPDPWWPWRGLAWWLARPRWWLRSLRLLALILALALTVGIAIGYVLWPLAEHAGWSWWWRLGLALGAALGSGLAVWLMVMPMAMSLALDDLAAAIRAEHGLPVATAPPGRAMLAALGMFRRTLPMRLGWSGVALGSGLLGPVAPLVALYAACVVLATDAMDTAAAAETEDPAARQAALAAERAAIHAGSLAILPLAALPLVGWLLLPPALVCGAALRRARSAQPPAHSARRRSP
jgi:hypothetical protein